MIAMAAWWVMMQITTTTWAAIQAILYAVMDLTRRGGKEG